MVSGANQIIPSTRTEMGIASVGGRSATFFTCWRVPGSEVAGGWLKGPAMGSVEG